MRESPNRSDLLAIARQVLKESIVPLLPEEQRYNGLMIANAMAIAARQFDTHSLQAEKEKLQALLESFPVEYQAIDWHTSPEVAIAEGLKALIRLLRDGQFDEVGSATEGELSLQQALLRDYLSLQVLQRVRESNPKALPDPDDCSR